jgi:YHS domain-containing protein
MIARVLLYSIVGLLVLLIFRGLFGPRLPTSKPNKRRTRAGGPDEEVLVRDPACGIYLPRTTGIKRKVRGKEHYFCSKDCLEAFQAGRDV